MKMVRRVTEHYRLSGNSSYKHIVDELCGWDITCVGIMKDVITDMIPFASLHPCAFALNRERERREGAKIQRTEIAVYTGVKYNKSAFIHVYLRFIIFFN